MRVGVVMYQTSRTKGQELVAQRMTRELRRQGHEAYIITSVYHDQEEVVSLEAVERGGGYLRSFEERLGIPVIRVASRRETWPPRRIAFVDFVSNLAKVVDDLKLEVLITHSTLWNGPEETAKFVEWRRNQAKGGAPVKPVIFCHMSHFQEPSDERYDLEERAFREAWNGASLPTIMKAADIVLVTTPYEKDQMKKIGVDDSKLFLFPGGIVPAEASSSGSDIRGKYSIPRGSKLVSYLGTVEERKNVLAVVKVASKMEPMRGLHFVIAGKLEGAYGKAVQAASSGAGNITVTGPLSDADRSSLIRETYLNINLSRSEALGLSQLEFMFGGVPVITSGVGGQSWIVKNGKCGVVLSGPEDIVGAERAIGKLAADVKKRDKMGERSRKMASQFVMAVLVQNLIAEISSKRRPHDRGTDAFEPGERLVEAWVKSGRRVAVTTKRLIIGTMKEGQSVMIPLSEITRVTDRLKVSRRTLAAGVAATLVSYVAIALGRAHGAYLESLFVSGSGHAPLDLSVFALCFVPFAVSAFVAIARRRREYIVEYGRGAAETLPREFKKALHLVDELTQISLFPNEQLPPQM